MYLNAFVGLYKEIEGGKSNCNSWLSLKNQTGGLVGEKCRMKDGLSL